MMMRLLSNCCCCSLLSSRRRANLGARQTLLISCRVQRKQIPLAQSAALRRPRSVRPPNQSSTLLAVVAVVAAESHRLPPQDLRHRLSNNKTNKQIKKSFN